MGNPIHGYYHVRRDILRWVNYYKGYYYMSCANSNCDKNALDSLSRVLMNVDGDFACSEQCAKDYREERDTFLRDIVHSDTKFNEWMNYDC